MIQLPADTPYTIGGDVSQHQGDINFAKYAKDFNFVFIRANHGLYLDKHYVRNTVEFRSRIPEAPYLFWEPLVPAKVQVDLFIKQIELAGGLGALPPVIDVERRFGSPKVLTALLDDVRKRLKVDRLIIYTRKDIWDYYGLGDTGDYFWWAQYPFATELSDQVLTYIIENRFSPRRSNPPGSWTFWQLSEKGPGKEYTESHGLDVDVFNGSKAAFDEFVGKVDPQKPTEPIDTNGPDDADILLVEFRYRMNVRSGPGIENPIIRKINVGERKYVLQVKEVGGYIWALIQYGEWVALEESYGKSFVTLLENQSDQGSNP